MIVPERDHLPTAWWKTLGLMLLCLVTGVGTARAAVAVGVLPPELRMPTGLALTFFLLVFFEVSFSRTRPLGPVLRRLGGALVIGAIMFGVGYWSR